MHYEFFVGPVNLEEIYPGVVERSSFSYTEEEEKYYIIHRGEEIQVEPLDIGWRSVDYDPEVERYIGSFQPNLLYRSTLPVMVRRVGVEHIWKPYHLLWEENEWLSLLIEGEKIIGFYRGETYNDDLGRKYSTHSYITISPQQRGRGLCEDFARFTYDKLFSLMEVEYISIIVASKIKTGACRCYMRAAKSLGLNTFAEFAYNGVYRLRKVEDCNQGGLSQLIFTFLPRVDEVMIEFSTM